MPDILSLGECMVEFFAEEPLAKAEKLQKAFAGDALNLLAAASGWEARAAFSPASAMIPFRSTCLAAGKVWASTRRA